MMLMMLYALFMMPYAYLLMPDDADTLPMPLFSSSALRDADIDTISLSEPFLHYAYRQYFRL